MPLKRTDRENDTLLVSTADMSKHCRITSDAENDLMLTYIKAAQAAVERRLKSSIVGQEYRLTLDYGFPKNCGDIYLNRGPVTAVGSVKYLDPDGEEVTMTEWTTEDQDGDYIVDLDSRTARISLPAGKYWPTTIEQIKAVTVEYTAGEVPDDDVIEAIKLIAACQFKFREELLFDNSNLQKLTGAISITELLSNHKRFGRRN